MTWFKPSERLPDKDRQPCVILEDGDLCIRYWDTTWKRWKWNPWDDGERCCDCSDEFMCDLPPADVSYWMAIEYPEVNK